MSWNFDNTLICNNSEHFHGWVTLYLLKISLLAHFNAYELELQLICNA